MDAYRFGRHLALVKWADDFSATFGTPAAVGAGVAAAGAVPIGVRTLFDYHNTAQNERNLLQSFHRASGKAPLSSLALASGALIAGATGVPYVLDKVLNDPSQHSRSQRLMNIGGGMLALGAVPVAVRSGRYTRLAREGKDIAVPHGMRSERAVLDVHPTTAVLFPLGTLSAGLGGLDYLGGDRRPSRPAVGSGSRSKGSEKRSDDRRSWLSFLGDVGVVGGGITSMVGAANDIQNIDQIYRRHMLYDPVKDKDIIPEASKKTLEVLPKDPAYAERYEAYRKAIAERSLLPKRIAWSGIGIAGLGAGLHYADWLARRLNRSSSVSGRR